MATFGFPLKGVPPFDCGNDVLTPPPVVPAPEAPLPIWQAPYKLIELLVRGMG